MPRANFPVYIAVSRPACSRVLVAHQKLSVAIAPTICVSPLSCLLNFLRQYADLDPMVQNAQLKVQLVRYPASI